jgi:two-component system alkaline phosphatase synthesis response regulator PhoP
MKNIKVLLVDDDTDILEFLSYNFQKEHFVVKTVSSGIAALDLVKLYNPDVIILDLMMPDMDGVEVCEHLRNNESTKNTIIVMLTARGEDYSQIAGLEAGADDYIIKPINPKVLISRVHALLRRQIVPIDNQDSLGSGKTLKIGDITIDFDTYQIVENGRCLNLPRKEFELISLLASKPGKVFTRTEIYDKIWGDSVVGDRTIDVHIRKLREKIGPRFIRTIKGVGYKFSI